MRQCPDCLETLEKVTRNAERYKTHRWYCNIADCLVIEVKFSTELQCGGFKPRRVTREAVARPIPLKGDTLQEIMDNLRRLEKD